MAFEWSDAWVLTAAVYAGEPKTRAALVAAGDYVNHAILTKAELDGGLRRLVAAGYLERVRRGVYALAPAGTVLAGRSVHKTLARVEAELGVSPA
ncbi:type IV toxin-antitoxin system AbiEi family antitoxin domain-containing protein [bacterium]|nr:type IV toxin-antitoxin system AbiEi family antitoxin domain-containing protein [bacterium]